MKPLAEALRLTLTFVYAIIYELHIGIVEVSWSLLLNGGQGQTKDRTNLELRTTSDNSLVTCKKQISNESLNVKWIWNTYLEDFIKPACFLSVSDVM